MKMDLTKYIMKIIVVPVLFLSLILIAHGSDDFTFCKRYCYN